MVRWEGRRQSRNIEDRRGIGAGPKIGGIGAVVLLVVGALLGIDPRALLQFAEGPSTGAEPYEETAEERESADFTSVILADTEETWQRLFQQRGSEYREPTLVLFTGSVRTGCGSASAITGPFYCPLDEKVYIDLSFYDELTNRLGAGGDFAHAYVIAHEVGHHVQNLMGTLGAVQSGKAGVSRTEANALSVRVELQADCFAGVWGHHAERARDLLEPGDVEEGLGAAAAIGDDRLQSQTQGRVVPESFTHGSSDQRVRWFRTGLETGDIGACDTFTGPTS